MHRRKAIAGALLIAAGFWPMLYSILYIVLLGSLPIYQGQSTEPAGFVGRSMNLGLSLTFFMFPFSFVVVGAGIWILISGAKELSLISMKKEA